MSYYRTTLLALLLIILAGVGYAQGAEDFSASSSQSYTLCPCSGQGYPLTIINTGSVTSTYTVAPQESLEPWITINPGSFTLQPGQGTNVGVFVTTACHVEGRLPVTLFVSTQSGLTKALEQELVFESCYNHTLTPGQLVDDSAGNRSSLDVEPQTGTYEVCAEEQAVLPVLARNNDQTFGNSYQFLVEGTSWASSRVGSYDLEAGSSGVLLADLRPSREDIGLHTLTLQSRSQRGDVVAQEQVSVDVQDCYASSVNIFPERESLCGGFTAAYPVEIRNTGTRSDRIMLSSEGADWARINWTYVDLPPNGSTSTTLVVTPPGGMEGEAELRVNGLGNADTAIGGNDRMMLSVTPFLTCYNIGIQSDKSVTNHRTEQYVSLTVTNNGQYPDQYALTLDGPAWVSLTAENVSLNPGQSHHFTLEISPDQSVEGEYQAVVSVEGIHHIQQRTISIDVRDTSGLASMVWGQFVLYRYYVLAALVLLALVLMFFGPLREYFGSLRKERRLYRMRRVALEAAREKRQAAKKDKPQKAVKKKQRQWSAHDVITWTLIAAAVLLSLAFAVFPTYMRNTVGPYLGYVFVGAAAGVAILIIVYGLYKAFRFLSGKIGK